MQLDMTKKMLERRGFNHHSSVTKNGDIFYFRSSNDSNNTSLNYFIENSKVTVDVLKNLTKISSDEDIIIIVHEKTITPDAKNNIKKMPSIQTFTYDELSFDLINLVPEHSKVLPKPPRSANYPKILESDPVCKYYNIKKGDVVRVKDEDEIVYRICI